MAGLRHSPSCEESPLPCAPPPSPTMGYRRNFGMAVLSSSPEFHDTQEFAEMSDSLVVALSRMRVEQSSLKRKKHSEHELPPGLENHDRAHRELKRAKNIQRQSENTPRKRKSDFAGLVPAGAVNSAFPVPSTQFTRGRIFKGDQYGRMQYMFVSRYKLFVKIPDANQLRKFSRN